MWNEITLGNCQIFPEFGDSNTYTLKMAKILVVDDEPQLERLVRQRFRRKVRSEEYTFEFADNGITALNKLSEIDDIDLILTDINMPQMDGLSFIAKLKEQGSRLKVVIVSAYGDMQNIRTAMNRGAYDFVLKPINFEDLEITINRALEETEMLRLAARTRKQLDMIQQELAAASEIQQAILPQNFAEFPRNNRIELYAKMIPAKEVGGDFYDFFRIDDDHLGLVIGDVSGKGMPASLFMAISRTLIKAVGLKRRSTAECLRQVNYLLCQDNPTSMFVTIFYGVLNVVTGELEYCSGGHNPSMIVHADGRMQHLDESRNLALGIVEDFHYEPARTKLDLNANLVLYTDGIPEAVNKQDAFYSDETMEEYLATQAGKSPRELTENMVDEVQRFATGTAQSDDITIMTIRNINI